MKFYRTRGVTARFMYGPGPLRLLVVGLLVSVVLHRLDVPLSWVPLVIGFALCSVAVFFGVRATR